MSDGLRSSQQAEGDDAIRIPRKVASRVWIVGLTLAALAISWVWNGTFYVGFLVGVCGTVVGYALEGDKR